MKACDSCIFWEIKRPNQYNGVCLNENNYRVVTAFDFYCKSYSERTDIPMDMQSNIRG